MKKGVKIIGIIAGAIIGFFILCGIIVAFLPDGSDEETAQTSKEDVVKDEDNEQPSEVQEETESEDIKPVLGGIYYTDEVDGLRCRATIFEGPDDLSIEIIFKTHIVSTDGLLDGEIADFSITSEENVYTSDNGRFTLKLISSDTFEITDSEPSDEFDFGGIYTLSEEQEYDTSITDDSTDDVEFISTSNFKDFIRDNANIGRTVKFRAVVYMTSNGEYVLATASDDGTTFSLVSDIRPNDPNLFKDDVVVFTGVYHGKTENGLQLSFTTVNIELEE